MKKMITCLVVVAFLISCFGTLALAKPIKEKDYTLTIPNIYGESTQPRVRTLTNYNINLLITGLSQNDSQWASDIMQYQGLPIGGAYGAGCALTCTTMVARHYGKNTDPHTFNIDMGSSACPLDWTQVGPKAGSPYVSNIDTSIQGVTWSQFFSYAPNALSAGKPVILGYWKHSDSTHYILVKALYGDGTQISDYGCIDSYDGQYYNLATIVGTKSLYKMVIYNRGLH